MKKLILAALAATAIAAPALADTANTITVTKFHQSYPYTGKATVEYTVGGTLPATAFAEITLRADGASATFTQNNVVAGANTNVIDFSSSFGGALVLSNASFTVTIEPGDGVQLWENGPYWAECNVGASAPEESGYYFWWGDTVGYTQSGGTWNDFGIGDGSGFYLGVTWVSSTGTQMSSSPFTTSACPTYDKYDSALQSEGWIDSSGNLVAAHDAATAHLGAPWRMPTNDEIEALVNNCTTTWITINGVNGRLVTGTGDYADRSIFLPAAGYGFEASLDDRNWYGYFWSSTSLSDYSYYAWHLIFDDSNDIDSDTELNRCFGQSVRPVRAFAGCSVSGSVTYDLEPTVVTVTKFHQSYPYTGRATVEYTVGGTLPANAVAEFTITSGDERISSATFVQSNIVAGANTNVIDFASSFGGALVLTNASFVVTITGGTGQQLGGVQLWEDGPYWAECNVGASGPEDYGYYFWWGDTVGYTRSGGWLVDNNPIGGVAWYYYSGVTWVSSTGTQMSSSPFDYCPTNGKDNSTLQSEGWIDASGNLVAAHDAATAHLGAPWRMPTKVEFSALVSNCTTEWISTNGVIGRLVTGKGAFADRSIFLPAAGYGDGSYLFNPTWDVYCWSSTPDSDASSINAWNLGFSLGDFCRNYGGSRYYGQSVRPVREFAGCSASGSVTYDSSPYENWAAANGVAGAWDTTDASGIHNVFRYVFGQPTGAFTNPPLIDIEIEGGNAVVITPPVSTTVGFAVSVVESSDVAGATVTRRKPLDATGRTEFPMGSAASRFYRLSAAEGDAEPDPGGVQLWENGPYWDAN